MPEVRLAGKTGNVKIDTDAGGAPESLLGITSWALTITSDAPETTGMDSSGAKAFLAGCTGFSGSVNFHWDTGETDYLATAGPPVVAPILRPGQRMEFELYVLDAAVYGTKTTADSYYTFDAIVTGFNPTVTIDGMVDGVIEFQGTDTLTYALAPV